ncbi:MAG: LON peptidase substrate-binding domain-containing protein [Caulobacteraceae bacterium]
MRDFRDAKSMAQTLREELRAKQVSLGHGESLEIVSKMFGFLDWNVLSAAIKGGDSSSQVGYLSRRKVPALPIKDAAPFPGTEMPFWLKRAESIEALAAAHAGGRQVVLVTQRTADVEEPGLADVYDMGVAGRILDIGPPLAALISRVPILEGSTQVIIQTHQRVFIRAFAAQSGGYEAEIEDVAEVAMREAPELLRRAIQEAERYASTNQATARILPTLQQLHDPGRVADVIAQSLTLPVKEKQALLAVIDSTERLESVMRHLEVA